MKYIRIVSQGISDEPMQDFGGRTPLEVAKTPTLTRLAKEGKVGQASFVPYTLGQSVDIACLSALGYDPKEFYTGIAPLDAAALGIGLGSEDLVFRCDFVSIFDGSLVDPRAGNISQKEAKFLMKIIAEKLSTKELKFVVGSGFKNFLVVSDPTLAASFHEMDCQNPEKIVGEKYTKHLPKGSESKVLTDLMDKAKEILEAEEINRVRIDLGENPANYLWFWGQGKIPNLPSFKNRFGRSGALFSKKNFAQGIAKITGLSILKEPSIKGVVQDFIFIYLGLERSKEINSLKQKIRQIENLDRFLAGLLQENGQEDMRICVSSDIAESITKKTKSYDHVPFLIWGTGVGADEALLFNEKIVSQSKLVFDKGHELMEYFLK